MSPPSATVVMPIGISQWRSLWSRVKTGWGFRWITT